MAIKAYEDILSPRGCLTPGNSLGLCEVNDAKQCSKAELWSPRTPSDATLTISAKGTRKNGTINFSDRISYWQRVLGDKATTSKLDDATSEPPPVLLPPEQLCTSEFRTTNITATMTPTPTTSATTKKKEPTLSPATSTTRHYFDDYNFFHSNHDVTDNRVRIPVQFVTLGEDFNGSRDRSHNYNSQSALIVRIDDFWKFVCFRGAHKHNNGQKCSARGHDLCDDNAYSSPFDQHDDGVANISNKHIDDDQLDYHDNNARRSYNDFREENDYNRKLHDDDHNGIFCDDLHEHSAEDHDDGVANISNKHIDDDQLDYHDNNARRSYNDFREENDYDRKLHDDDHNGIFCDDFHEHDVTNKESTKKDKTSTRNSERTSTRVRTPPSPTTSKRAATETARTTTTCTTSTKPPKQTSFGTSPVPTLTDVIMATTLCTTETSTAMEEFATPYRTRCESSCDYGWTEGEQDCMKALEVEAMSYRNLSILCSRIGGVSLPVQTDFENHNTYQLMEILAKSRIPPTEWVFMEPDPNGDYRLLLVAFVCSGLFRHPDVFSLEPYIGCRTHNWIVNTAWVLGLHAWLMEAHLCWTTMSNQAMNVWDFNDKWYLCRENRLKAIVIPSLVFTTVSHVLFWEEVPHSWSFIGTFHDSGSSHVILNFSMVLTVAMYSVSWAQTAWNYRRKKWNQYVRFYRTTNDDPWEYGKHMEVCEKNVNFILAGTVLHYGAWVLSIMANDLYNEKVAEWFCSWTIAYLFLLMAQTAQTNNNALCFFKNFCTIYGPYHWAPRINYSSMLYRMEYVELKQPERHKRLFEAAERRRQKKRDKEWAAIEKKNDVLRKRFAEDTGLLPEDCPPRHLFHHPEEGPAKMFPAPYKIKPGDRKFLPLLLRDFFSKELVKAYLTNRKELPDPNGRKAALHAILRTCRAKLWHFRGKHSHALAQFWTDISNYIVDKDRHVAPKRIDDALAILATRDMSLQKAAFTIDWDNAMGPMEAIRLKDLDVIMHCQVPYFMETFEENLAVVNAQFDAFYEDDVNIPLYTRPKIEPKRGVENRLMDEDYSRNPRKRPLDKLFYEVDMPSFVGPLQRDEMWSTAVDVVDRRRHFFQARIDEDWSVHEEIGAILIARKAFRQKNRKSFIEFLMKNHRDVDGLDLTNRYLVEKKNMRRKTTCRDPEPTEPPTAEQK
ncbi:hypothetical protein QR680_007116 [Steinernema hermaphroditum]|uniref:Uncharacterized protein n=1 Tax=Steinernema hermaphroditum TaxID=289476 RepID=A0AA39LYK2_9BILA|nr:hypothetical protein QR680_007116 [Steinernema hermaphroditum]